MPHCMRTLVGRIEIRVVRLGLLLERSSSTRVFVGIIDLTLLAGAGLVGVGLAGLSGTGLVLVVDAHFNLIRARLALLLGCCSIAE